MTNFEIENALKKTALCKGLFLNICHCEKRVSKSNLKLECEHMLRQKMNKKRFQIENSNIKNELLELTSLAHGILIKPAVDQIPNRKRFILLDR